MVEDAGDARIIHGTIKLIKHSGHVIKIIMFGLFVSRRFL